MSKPGTQTITIPEEYHTIIKKIAERNKLSIKNAVIEVFRANFPEDFPKETMV